MHPQKGNNAAEVKTVNSNNFKPKETRLRVTRSSTEHEGPAYLSEPHFFICKMRLLTVPVGPFGKVGCEPGEERIQPPHLVRPMFNEG